MGALSKPDLDGLIAAGCTACGSKKLTFLTYVDGLFAMMGGEPIKRVVWVYDGEKFLDGVYEVGCGDCRSPIFRAEDCPRCHAPDGLKKALGTENAYPVPALCPSCENEETRFIALLPARVVYEGLRAEKARSSHELHEPGVHGYRIDCRDCGTVAELKDRCPLCESPGPLRARPA